MPPGSQARPPRGGGHESWPWPFWLEHCRGVCALTLSAWHTGLSRHVAAPNSARWGGAGSFTGLHPCGVLRLSAQCLRVRLKVGTPQPHGQGHRALATAKALCGGCLRALGRAPGACSPRNSMPRDVLSTVTFASETWDKDEFDQESGAWVSRLPRRWSTPARSGQGHRPLPARPCPLHLHPGNLFSPQWLQV